jgi:hypothetical protein
MAYSQSARPEWLGWVRVLCDFSSHAESAKGRFRAVGTARSSGNRPDRSIIR